jgi:uncharacterized protein
MAHPNEEIVRQGFTAFGAGDVDTLRRLIAPDIVWHAPGRSPVSGTFKGIDEVLAYFGKLATITDGTFKAEVHDIVGNDEHVFAAYVASGRRGERSLRDGAVLLFHVENEQLTEAWLLVGDQYAVDAFFS